MKAQGPRTLRLRSLLSQSTAGELALSGICAPCVEMALASLFHKKHLPAICVGCGREPLTARVTLRLAYDALIGHARARVQPPPPPRRTRRRRGVRGAVQEPGA